jgi:hypothetical protein
MAGIDLQEGMQERGRKQKMVNWGRYVVVEIIQTFGTPLYHERKVVRLAAHVRPQRP